MIVYNATKEQFNSDVKYNLISDNTLFQDAIRITMKINNSYHTPEELVSLISELTGKYVDETVRLFPPFWKC
jgi:hypothetical protein